MFHFPANLTLYFLYKLHPLSFVIHAAIQGWALQLFQIYNFMIDHYYLQLN